MKTRFVELSVDDEIYVNGQLSLVRGWLEDGRLHVLFPSLNRSMFFEESEFWSRFRDGEISFKSDLKSSASIPPDDHRWRKAEALLAVCEDHDRHHPPGTRRGIKATVARNQQKFIQRTQSTLTASVLKTALDKGVPGNRSIFALLDNRGRGPRNRYESDVEQIISETVDYYWSNHAHRHSDAWDEYRRLRRKYIDANLGSQGTTTWPAKTAIRNRINDAETYERFRTKYGKHAANCRFSGSHPCKRAKYALEVVQLDHTRCDAHVVDDAGNHLGRPWLTLCIDEYSGAILAIVVTMLAPSLAVVMEALRRTVMGPPKGFAERMGLFGEWIYFGKPSKIKKDRATELRESMEDFLADIGIGAERARRRVAKDKALVEGTNTPFSKLFRSLPGGIPYDVGTLRRLNVDPAKDAVLTLEELERFCWQFAENYNEHGNVRDDGTTPRERFLKSLAQCPRKPVDPSVFDRFGYVRDVTVDRSGVRVEGMHFHDPDAVSRILDHMAYRTQKRSRRSGLDSSATVRTKCRIPPVDVRYIFVWDAVAKEWERLENTHEDYWGHDIEYCRALRHQRRARSTGDEAAIERSSIRTAEARNKAWQKKALKQRGSSSERPKDTPKELPVSEIEERHLEKANNNVKRKNNRLSRNSKVVASTERKPTSASVEALLQGAVAIAKRRTTVNRG